MSEKAFETRLTGSPRFGASRGITALWPEIYVLLAILAGAGLPGKTALIARIVPLPHAVMVVLIAAGLCLPLLWRRVLRHAAVIAPLGFLFVLAILLFVFPKIEALSAIGRGSDQAACVIVGARELIHGQWPYQRAEMWSHNPMSCGPGWIALQMPVTAVLGYQINLIVIWILTLGIIWHAVGREATFRFMVLLYLSPGFWLAAADGTDFLTFGLTVAALWALAEKYGRSRVGRIILVILSSLLAQFRAATLILPSFFTRQFGWSASLLAVTLSILWQIAFLLWNPGSFILDGPLHILVKLTGFHLFASTWIPASLELSIPVFIASLLIVWLERRFRWRFSVVNFLLLVFFVPALLNLIKQAHHLTTLSDALQHWEGGLWIVGCLPMAALIQSWPISPLDDSKSSHNF